MVDPYVWTNEFTTIISSFEAGNSWT